MFGKKPDIGKQVKETIIDRIPVAFGNLGVPVGLRPQLENYIVNRIIESSTELRKLSNKDFIAFLKSL
jgi:hypothetical protein